MASHLPQEDGFSVVEITIALVILGIVILMTVGPTSTGFNLLTRADVTTVETNLAQGRVEEIRSLEYKDVGYSSSLPQGVLEPTETVTVGGKDYLVATDISYFGSANGGDVIPQGGDGVEGHYDSGIDFKQVTVTVSRADGSYEPVAMTTIIAPPSLAANDNLANVIVDLTKVEPEGRDASIVPFPKVYLVYDDDSSSVAYPGTPSAEQVFAGIDANESSGARYFYYGRLGTHLDDVSSSTVHWRIYPEDLASGTDRVHVAPVETGILSMRVYLPAELHVELYDSADGSPVSGIGTLDLSGPTGTHIFTTSDPEWNGSGWDITEVDGYRLVPGEYSFDVKINGYTEVDDRTNVVVPDGYPDSLSHTETFSLDESQGWTLTVHAVDDAGVKLNGVNVQFTDASGTTSEATDDTGTASHFSEDEGGGSADVTVVISSSLGHQTYGPHTVTLTADREMTVVLGTPSGYGLITFTDNNLGVDHYWYQRKKGGADDPIVVLPNVDGLGSAAVSSGNWKVRKVCLDGSSITQGSGRHSSPLHVERGKSVVWSILPSQTCPAP